MVVHRKFSPELKARVVLELISGATSLAEVCRQYNLLTLELEIAKKASLMSHGSLGRSERWS
jgi:hypothetical protein